MSRENVEIVRASMEAWNTRDMDALRKTYAEDVVTWPPKGWSEAGPFVGRERVIGQWERVRQAIPAHRPDAADHYKRECARRANLSAKNGFSRSVLRPPAATG